MKTQRPGLDGGRRRHGGRKLYRFSISSNNGLGLSTSLEISVSPRRLSPKSQYLLDGSGPLLLSSTIEGLFHPRKPTALIESREMEQIQFNPGGHYEKSESLAKSINKSEREHELVIASISSRTSFRTSGTSFCSFFAVSCIYLEHLSESVGERNERER
ncbi:uncharacterized protein LOC112168152 isoform X3 [Rosa chinensis]|uniref:uncharacterized protein LOC112168152 isoform X3 n=1 Tax=Rosa chinensis TaxID=74649 RepID=UPI001AD8F30F|nr:uncharacterized protein LOC112168152 isoform X3 [Rosa chinensis]